MIEVLEKPPKSSAMSPQGFALHSVVVLWTARRRIVKVALGAVILAVSVAFLVPSRYESSAKLMPPDQDQSPNLAPLMAMAGNGALAGMAGNMLGVKNTSDLFTEILRSRAVEDRVIDQNGLRSVYGFRDYDSTRQALNRRTSLAVDRKSGIITITVQDRAPQRASEIAQSYIAALNAVVNLSSTSSARRQREFIEQRLKEVKLDLDAAEHELGDFSSKNRTLDLKDQGRAEMELASQLQGALANAQSELEALHQAYAPDNIRVRMAQAKVTQLKAEFAKLEGTATNIPAQEGGDNNAGAPSLRQLPLLGAGYADYYRQAQAQEALFATLTQQYEAAKLQEVKEIPSVRVLDPPNVPERRAFPSRARLSILAFTVMLGMYCAGLLVYDAWTLWDTNDERKQLISYLGISCKEDIHRILTQFSKREN